MSTLLEETTDPAISSSMTEPFVSRLRIRNFKSIGQCEVSLGALTLLVGRNASGKSNTLDALSFVTDGLQHSLDQAIKVRGGLDEVRRRSTGHPRNFSIELELSLDRFSKARYGFEITAKSGGSFVVKNERLWIDGEGAAFFHRGADGQVVSNVADLPPVQPDRLFLVNAASRDAFRPVYDALLSMGFYSFSPQAMRELASPDSGELLHRDGANIASVIARLKREQPEVVERIKKYLQVIVPGIVDVDRVALGPKETLRFRQKVAGASNPWKFYAQNMSDGTLRILGALIAVTQLAEHPGKVRLVGIEEPETALHPAAAGSLMDALGEAAPTQVLVTSHSPDLLDHASIDDPAFKLLVVQAEGGETSIAPVDPVSLDAVRKHLFTAGELLRIGQLEPDPADLERQQKLVFDLSSPPIDA